MKNAINWFEIPTSNLDKAATFYEQTLGVTLKREDFGGVPHAVFPAEKNGTQQGVAGAVVARTQTAPGDTGVVIYLNAPDGVAPCLERAIKAGARTIMPLTSIGPNGWIGMVKDLDGNVIGLHAY